MEVYKNRKIATCNNSEDIISSIRLDLQAYQEMNILMGHRGLNSHRFSYNDAYEE